MPPGRSVWAEGRPCGCFDVPPHAHVVALTCATVRAWRSCAANQDVVVTMAEKLGLRNPPDDCLHFALHECRDGVTGAWRQSTAALVMHVWCCVPPRAGWILPIVGWLRFLSEPPRLVVCPLLRVCTASPRCCSRAPACAVVGSVSQDAGVGPHGQGQVRVHLQAVHGGAGNVRRPQDGVPAVHSGSASWWALLWGTGGCVESS